MIKLTKSISLSDEKIRTRVNLIIPDNSGLSSSLSITMNNIVVHCYYCSLFRHETLKECLYWLVQSYKLLARIKRVGYALNSQSCHPIPQSRDCSAWPGFQQPPALSEEFDWLGACCLCSTIHFQLCLIE